MSSSCRGFEHFRVIPDTYSRSSGCEGNFVRKELEVKADLKFIRLTRNRALACPTFAFAWQDNDPTPTRTT